MEGNRVAPARYILLNGLSIALYMSWSSVLLRWRVFPFVDGALMYSLIPVAAAGFLCATLLNRFLVRKAAGILKIAAFVIALSLTVLLCFIDAVPALLIALLFALFFSLFFLVIPIFAGSATLTVFGGSLFFSVFFLLGQNMLIGVLDIPGAVTVCAGLSLCAAFVLTLPAVKSDATLRDDPISIRLSIGRPLFVLFCVITYAGCLVLTARIIELSSVTGASSSVAFISGALLFAAIQVVSLYLVQKQKIWQFSYIVFTAFALGALLLWVVHDNELLVFLPLMLLISSLSGMLLFFFAFMHNLLAPINRPLMTGFVYVLVFPLIFVFVLPGTAMRTVLSALTGEWSLLVVAAVLLVSPMFLRSFDSRAAQVPPPPPSEEPPVGDTEQPQSDEKTLSELELSLTGAERRVYELILLGYSNQQIADELYISINTVKFHVRNILAKSGMQRKNQLVGIYLRQQK